MPHLKKFNLKFIFCDVKNNFTNQLEI